MKPKDLIKVSIKKGYNVLGVVDHNCIKGGLKAKKIAGKKLLVIPGEEIMTRYGEIIVFLSDGKYNHDLIDICERAKDLNHFIITPHPFDFLRFRSSLKYNINKIKEFIDAIEVFNSRVMINRCNKIASRYAQENKISKIAGSDAHFIEEIGNAAVYLNCENNIDSIFNYIKKNKIKFEGKRCSIYHHFKTNVFLPIEKLI
ncbi:MAG: PHP domain-containing protein [Candidatus Aenigmatarchaeota archaeon]